MLIRLTRTPRLLLALVRERYASPGRVREPEPMIMDDPEAVAGFHEAGSETSLPVYDFNARAIAHLLPAGGRLLDLGSGSARLLGYLAQRRPDVRIIGCELSNVMLDLGRQWIAKIGIDDRVELRKLDMTEVARYVPEQIHVVSCVWALHHLPSDDRVAACLHNIEQIRRRTGCAVWLFDFVRCRDARTFPAVADAVRTPGPVAIREAIASERAAFTFQELRTQLDAAGLGDLRGAEDRFLGTYQCHWAPGSATSKETANLWENGVLSWNLRVLAAVLRRCFPEDVGS